MMMMMMIWRHGHLPQCDVKLKIWFRQLKNNPAKFHPDPIWNDGALSFSEDDRPNKNKNNNNNNNNNKNNNEDV